MLQLTAFHDTFALHTVIAGGGSGLSYMGDALLSILSPI